MDFFSVILNDSILVAIAQTLLHFLWQGTVIALVLYVCLRFTAHSSQGRYWMSLGALIGILVSVMTTFSLIYESNLKVSGSKETIVALGGSFDRFEVMGLNASMYGDVALSCLTIFWFAGVVLLSIRLLFETAEVYRLPYRNTRPVPDDLQLMFDSLKRQLGVWVPAKLVISEHVDVPMVIGWISPFVLLPVSISTGLSNQQLRMLIAHELAHVKRYDFAVNFIQSWLEIMLFFHPCVKWISEQIRIEREHCCDDRAIDICGDHRAYARTLVEAESLRQMSTPQLAMAATAGDLKNRVLRLVSGDKNTKYRGSNTLSVIAAGATGIVLIALVANHKNTSSDLLDKTADKVLIEVSPTVHKDTQLSDEADETATNAEVELASNTIVGSDKEDVQKIEQTFDQKGNVGETSQTSQVSAVTNKKLPDTDSYASNKPLVQTSTETFVAPKPVSDIAITKEPIESEQLIATDKTSNRQSQPDEILEAKVTKSLIKEDSQSKIVAPKLLRSRMPNYPWYSLNRNQEADIRVSFIVKENGRIDDITFEEGTNKKFKREVKRVLKYWRYEPGTVDGSLTAMQMHKIFSFSDRDAPQPQAMIGTRLMR